MMSVEYTIRRAYPSDANDIAAAHRDSIRSVGPQFYPPSVVEDWEEGLTPDIYVNAMEGGEVFFVAIGQIDNDSAAGSSKATFMASLYSAGPPSNKRCTRRPLL